MPTSKVTRVRNDGFSKIMASVLPFSVVRIGAGIGFDLAGHMKKVPDLLRREVANREEILACMSTSLLRPTLACALA